MSYSFYSNKVLLAEDLTSFIFNKYLWQNTPFGSKIVAPTTGQYRVLLYDAFTNDVKATVVVLEAYLLDLIKQIFAYYATTEGVTISNFTDLAIYLRKEYFTYGVDAGSFLNYSVILAGLSGFFYAWGCEDVPEHAVELISVIIPDYEMFHPFCIRLQEACSSFLQREQNTLATVLQGSNCLRFSNPFDGGFKCDCFEYKETGESFKIVFKNRKLAMEKHVYYCVPNASYNLVTYKPFDQREFKERFMHSCNLKSGNILTNIPFPSIDGKYNTRAFKTLSNEINFEKEQKYFGFPYRPFFYIMRNTKYPCPASEDVSSMPSSDLEQKQTFTDTTEENVHANDSFSSKEQEEALDVFFNAFKTEVETSLKQITAKSTDSNSEYSFSESSISESDASQNELVIGQVMSSTTTNNLKQPLPPPHISKESEDCESQSNKLPDLLTSLDTMEISVSRTAETSCLKADSPKLLNRSSGEKSEGTNYSTSNTMSGSLTPQIKALFQNYQWLGFPKTSLGSCPTKVVRC